MSYKVAVYGPTDWALGSINSFLKKHLRNAGYEVRLVNWRDADAIVDGFNWCDVFITEVHMYERWFRHYPREIQEKGLYVWHHLSEIPGFSLDDEPFGHFATKIPVDPTLVNNYFAITKDTKASADAYYGLNVGLLPVGTDDDFWDKRKEFGRINKIGCVMSPEDSRPQYTSVKRYDMFSEIGEKAGLDYDYCFGKLPITGSYIYKDFDLIVNTSTHEGLPTPFLECAAAKVPFISTKVGIVPQYSSVKTFETVDEAIEIINELNSDPEILKKYVEDVYEEVAMNNLWEDIVDEYYTPAFDKIVESTMPDVSKELVVSHFNDSLSWLDKIKKTDITVYTKSDTPTKRSAIRMKNEGMIEHTIYSHLAERYDSLADYTIFCQDRPFDHVSDFVNYVNYFDPSDQNNALLHKGGYWGWHDGESLRENDWDGYPDYNKDWHYVTPSGTIPRPHRVLKVDEVWNELFETEMPEKLMFCPAAHFCVSRDQALKRSKRFYERVAEMCEEREWGPWEIERVTWAIFDESIKAKEDLSFSKKKDKPHLVVSRYNEDVNWIKDMGCSYTLYNKGEDDPGLPCINKENVGREASTFLDHIIDNYDDLEGPIAFLQGDPFDHFTESSMTSDGSRLHGLPIVRHDELLDSLIKNYEGGVTFIGRGSVCYGDGMPWWKGLEVDEFADRIGVKSDYYAFCIGAQYIVPSEKIKSKSLEWWKNLRDIFFEDWLRGAHLLERLWFTIFTNE